MIDKDLQDRLVNPKKPGPWWAYQILEKERRGEPVTITAHELAQAAIARDKIRQGEL